MDHIIIIITISLFQVDQLRVNNKNKKIYIELITF